jgi:hypothetical protein
MTVRRRIELVCDVCPAVTAQRLFFSVPTTTEARKRARVGGWRRDKMGRDVCPKHPKLKGAKVLRPTP